MRKLSLLMRRAASSEHAREVDNTNKERIKHGGYGVYTDTDGDHAYSRFEANDAAGLELKGTFDFTGGTGKYKGITGKNTWRSVGSGAGRSTFNDAQPRKVPVLGLLGNRNVGPGRRTSLRA